MAERHNILNALETGRFAMSGKMIPTAGGVDTEAGYLIAWGEGTPTDTDAGYAIGCQYFDITNAAWYRNNNTVASATWVLAASGAGDVVGPSSTTENSIPQWAATTRTLKDGLTLATTVGVTGVDTALVTEQGIREALTALPAATKLDDLGTPDDNTDLDASTTVHGLVVKATAPAAGLRNVVGIDNTETAYTNKALFDATNPAVLGTLDTGSAMTAARRDHVHTLPKLDDCDTADDNTDLDASTTAHGLLVKATAPSAGLINFAGIANAEVAYTNKPLFDATNPEVLGTLGTGSATVAARRDHVHTLPKLDDCDTPDDNTDLDVSTSAHGLVPKGDNDTSHFLRGDAAWSALPIVTDLDPLAASATDTDIPSEKAMAEIRDGWQKLTDTTHYDDQAASTSTITMNADLTAYIKVGMPIKFKLSGTYYYAIVTTSAASLLTIAGAPLTTGDGDLSELWIGKPERVVNIAMQVTSTYADGAEANLLAADMNTYLAWRLQKAYCVSFSATQKSVDTGTEPKVNLQINNAQVSSADSGNGVQLSTAGAWVDNSAVAITVANYDINWGEELEVECTVAGGSADAEDLTVIGIFVLE